MNTITDFDRRAAAWLADGPSELNDRVLDAALREVHLTPQRREWFAPRRLLPMLRIASLAAAIIVVVAGGIVIIGGGRGLVATNPSPRLATQSAAPTTAALPTGTPVPLASMPPLSAEFVSPWYGYRVKYPAGWQTTPGQGPWPFGLNLLHGDPHLDQIMSPTGRSTRFVGASIALPADVSWTGFRAFASPQEPNACEQLAPLSQPVFIDHVQALVSLNGCHSLSSLGGNIYDVLVIAGGRGYDFTIDGDLTAAEAQAWLDSITLDPASALPASPGPS